MRIWKGRRVRKTKILENILIRLLMGKKKEFFDFVKIKGKIYRVSIQPYVSPGELFKRAVNSGVFTADELKEEAYPDGIPTGEEDTDTGDPDRAGSAGETAGDGRKIGISIRNQIEIAA